ncbi:BolA/IbaG family iron-sulfur metabolism protein [Suttonella sp. R2A3]|uniref:BolA/IbaG family iron-sulfur metabolism protein n=1 Tax=Suttonella sp. R2A3 TaxID=2908648 RepID=UPI001F2BB150|nr:BolA/IbaG family iron-sulfur metabolism protein [Suttonella sp. R2A3]UJF24558.1 BolA/IbaG family iron-sulfur metabolism protein [Suttonella sp. R2A3]
MQEQLISERIREVLSDAEVELSSPDGVHYSATVRSAQFVGMKRLEQHRVVMNALKDVLGSNEVHALALKTEAK